MTLFVHSKFEIPYISGFLKIGALTYYYNYVKYPTGYYYLLYANLRFSLPLLSFELYIYKKNKKNILNLNIKKLKYLLLLI